MKPLTGGLIFCHRTVAGRLPKLTNVVARGVVSREPAWITAGSSDHVLSSMNIPSKWRLVDNRDATVPSNPAIMGEAARFIKFRQVSNIDQRLWNDAVTIPRSLR
jgi:hypothetical protein